MSAAPISSPMPDDVRHRGERNLMWDAAFATFVGVFASGVVLVAFALHKGADADYIGLLAALPFLTQLLQAPAVRLVERLRNRRRIATISLLAGRFALIPLPFAAFAPAPTALSITMAVALLHFGLNAIAACAWNSWIRDFIPTDRLGAFFARRSVYAAGVTILGGAAAGLALELGARDEAAASAMFAVLFTLAFGFGMLSTWRLSLVPEPAMRAPREKTALSEQLLQPFSDVNFRRLIAFGCLWQFAVNLATPFFTIYFLRDVGLGMGAVMALTVLSQLANVAVLRFWGALSDRFSNKSVLLAAAPTFLVCVALVALTRSFESIELRLLWLATLHIVMGMTAAGIGIATGNIVLKLAPADYATPYLSANALATSLAAGVAPIVGGALAQFFASRRLSVSAEWIDAVRADAVVAVQLAITGWEFYFAGAAILGLFALHRLALVREEGEIEHQEMMQHILVQARRSVLNMSPVAGLRIAAAFPAGALIARRQRRPRRLRDLH